MNQALLNYVKDAISRGYSPAQIKQKLLQSGYSDKQAEKVINAAQGKGGLSMPVLWVVIIAAVALIAALAWFGLSMLDTTSIGDCGPCQYSEDDICMDYECCEDSECLFNERCSSNKCSQLRCGNCEYAKDHKCLPYECCYDEDCPDGDECIEHICQEPEVIDGTPCTTDADCFDNNSQTKDICMPRSKVCSNPDWECIDDDDFCPDKCHYGNDNDCPEIDYCERSGECDDGNECTKDECAGTPKECRNTQITECENDDGCCPDGCVSTRDNDC